MTGLGVGPRVVDEMDTREVDDLMCYWVDHPPAHIAVSRIYYALGGKPSQRSGSVRAGDGVVVNGKAQTPEQFAAMLGVKLEGG
mgnify:CR=1 FL=1